MIPSVGSVVSRAVLATLAVVIAVAATLAIVNSRGDKPDRAAVLHGAVGQPMFPQQYAVNPGDIDRKASFPVYHPTDSAVNDSTISQAYVLPNHGHQGGVVQLMYPLPASQAAGVRLPYLSLSEEPWPYGDPDQFFDEDIATNPDVGKRRCDFNDVPALCLDANSASDATGENAAYVRLDYNGISVELWGGNNLQRLLGIAHGLTRGGNNKS